jgi:hypothetical protein
MWLGNVTGNAVHVQMNAFSISDILVCRSKQFISANSNVSTRIYSQDSVQLVQNTVLLDYIPFLKLRKFFAVNMLLKMA